MGNCAHRIGGGLVAVPLLTLALAGQGLSADLAVPMAVATSLGSMLLTSASSIVSHHRLGGMDYQCIARLAPATAAGAAAGAWLATWVDGTWLARCFALVAAVIGLRMLAGARTRPAARSPYPRAWWLAGPVIGGISALVGIGGGSFNVPYLARNGYPMAKAVAVAAACGWPIALAGSLTFILIGRDSVEVPGALGYWYLPGLLGVGLGGVLAAPVGARLAHRLPAVLLRRIFGVVLLLIAARMALQ